MGQNKTERVSQVGRVHTVKLWGTFYSARNQLVRITVEHYWGMLSSIIKFGIYSDLETLGLQWPEVPSGGWDRHQQWWCWWQWLLWCSWQWWLWCWWRWMSWHCSCLSVNGRLTYVLWTTLDDYLWRWWWSNQLYDDQINFVMITWSNKLYSIRQILNSKEPSCSLTRVSPRAEISASRIEGMSDSKSTRQVN